MTITVSRQNNSETDALLDRVPLLHSPQTVQSVCIQAAALTCTPARLSRFHSDCMRTEECGDSRASA